MKPVSEFTHSFSDLDKEHQIVVQREVNDNVYEVFSSYGTSAGRLQWDESEGSVVGEWLKDNVIPEKDFALYLAMEKQHMKPEIVNQGWYMTDTPSEGVQYYPASMFTAEEIASQTGIHLDDIKETGRKWGVRLSADGYLDASDWSLHETVNDCVKHLIENFGDEVQVLNPEETSVYQYVIDLDERGEFNASVRDAADNVVCEINGGQIFEDGFMDHKNDTDGLTDYLVHLGVIRDGDEVLGVTQFESRLEQNAKDNNHAFICVDDARVTLRMGNLTASDPHKGTEQSVKGVVDYYNRLSASHGAESFEVRNDSKLDIDFDQKGGGLKMG